MQLLFVRDAGTAFSDGRKLLGSIRLVSGTVISLTCSLLIFISYITQNAFFSNAIFCFIPVAGLFVYDIIMYAFSSTLFFNQIGVGEVDAELNRTQFFKQGVKRSVSRLLIVYVPSILILLHSFIRSLPFPQGGVVAILVGMLANAIYWMTYGLLYARSRQEQGEKFIPAFYTSEAGRFGLAVVGVLSWLGIFLVINAGGRLLGL